MMEAETEGTDETLESFSRSLDELTVNSKPLINILSRVAAENVLIAAAIVETINEHLKKAPSVVTLPILYLIDSIMKNVGGDYINLFSSTLKDSFANIFSVADKATRNLMYHLRQSWNEILSSQDLSFIDKQVHALDPYWLMNTKTFVTHENQSLKILVNPDFLPTTGNGILEEDDEETLRQQLIQQMRKRKLEKEQSSKEKENCNEKEHSAAYSTQKEDTSKIQADSTTVEKLAIVPIEENHLVEQSPTKPSTLTSAENSNTSTKPVNSEIFQLLSNLIVEGSKKIQCSKEERFNNGREVCEKLRRGHREYRKRENLSKRSADRAYCYSHTEDTKYYCDYSSRRDSRCGRSRKFTVSPSHLFKEAKHRSHSTSASSSSSYGSYRRCESPSYQASSDYDASSHINSERMALSDHYNPPPTKKFLQTISERETNVCPLISIPAKQELLLQKSPPLTPSRPKLPLLFNPAVECSQSVPVHLGHSPQQRTFDNVNSQTTFYPGHRKTEYVAKRSPCMFDSNIQESRHEDIPVEVKPVHEIDYKHGCGAPVKILLEGLNKNNGNIHCPAQPPINQVSLPSLSAPDLNNWQMLGSNPNGTFGMTRFNSVLASNNQPDHFHERRGIGTWGSKIMTQDLTVECNMLDFPSFGKKFVTDQCVQESMNSINCDTLTTEVRFHSENTQYLRNVTAGPWHERANNSLQSMLMLHPPVFQRGGKKRHRFTQNLRRQAIRSAQNARSQPHFSCEPRSYDQTNETPCSTSQPCDLSTSDQSSVFRPCVNVHALFQSLCQVGLLIPPNTQNVTERKETTKAEIYEVDFKDLASFRRRQPGVIEELHYGLQCSSCGDRFVTEQTSDYREHLDWHFKKNHRTRDSKCFENRKWFCTKTHWIQSELFVDEKEKEDMEEPSKEESSVPSNYHKQGAVCEVCSDVFEEFFNEDQDEWHLKDCLSSEGLPYHPSCFKDLKMSTVTPTSSLLLEGQNNSERCDSKLSSSRIEAWDETGNGCEVENVAPHVLFGNENESSHNCENLVQEEIQTEQPMSTACEVAQRIVADEEIVGTNVPSAGDKIDLKIELARDISVSEVNDAVGDAGRKDVSCPSHETNCAIKELGLYQMSTVEVEGKETSGDCVDDSNLQCTASSPLDVSCEEHYISVLKPTLIGRKLTKLPPSIKGSETSNLCCIS